MSGPEDSDGAATRRLREAIDLYLAREGPSDLALFTRVLDVWDSVVGSGVAGRVRPTGISDGTLFVDVDSPAWFTEVGFLAPQLLVGLEARLGTPIAERVKARVRGGSGVE